MFLYRSPLYALHPPPLWNGGISAWARQQGFTAHTVVITTNDGRLHCGQLHGSALCKAISEDKHTRLALWTSDYHIKTILHFRHSAIHSFFSICVKGKNGHLCITFFKNGALSLHGVVTLTLYKQPFLCLPQNFLEKISFNQANAKRIRSYFIRPKFLQSPAQEPSIYIDGSGDVNRTSLSVVVPQVK